MYKCISTSIYSCNSSSLFLSRWYGNNSRGTIILNCFPPCMYAAAASVFSMYNYNRYDFDLLMICSGDGGNGGGGGSNGGSSLVFSRYLCQDLSKLPCPAGEPFHSLSISFSHLSLKDEQSRRWDKHTDTHTQTNGVTYVQKLMRIALGSRSEFLCSSSSLFFSFLLFHLRR